VAEALVGLGREPAGQRVGQPDDEHTDAAGGDVGAQGADLVGGVDQRLGDSRPGLAGLVTP